MADISIHERGYWLSKDLVSGFHCFDKPLSEALTTLFSGNIIDIGCGPGEYVKAFLNKGINCVGYDGSPLTNDITNGICNTMDFSNAVDIGQFDVVLSLEVGEHIPREYEEIYIDNLVRASKKYICLSWAIEGQGGIGHVNCHNNDYVINELTKRGFSYEKNISEELRNVSTLPWFKNTIMVFVKN